jgi:pimeloyl-ACP methyl ester carboxylesterase
MRTTVIVREGARLIAEDTGGEGIPTVFQHGLGGDALQVAEAFPDGSRFRRLTLECRGHGRSEAGDFRYLSIATFADDVAAMIEASGLGPVALGGISMGAAISLRLAVRRPDLVRALVLARPAWVVDVAPPNMAATLQIGQLLLSLPPAEARAAFEASATARQLALEAPDNLSTLLGFFERPAPDVTAALLTAISLDGPQISADEVRAVRVPTLIIATGRDEIHPVGHAEELAGMIAGARLMRITSKSDDRAGYVADMRAALSGFLGRLP